MKTIEVTDEMYSKLMELSKEMTSQDPRCTAMPHLFQIQTTEEAAAYPGCGEEIWVDYEGGELRSDEDIKEWIHDHLWDNSPGCADRILSKMDEYDIETYLKQHGWYKVRVTTEHKYQNGFLTAKACEEHIIQNDYHYKNPVCYLNHAWRNPEMELVSKFLCGLSGGEIYK